MNEKVILEIPEHIFERARRVAQDQQKDVTDVVAQVLDIGLSSIETVDLEPEIKREIEAFRRFHPLLWSRYPGEYAAVHNGELVDHDSDRVALLDRITKKFPKDFVLVRPIREEPEIIHLNRSIRWVK